MSAADLRRNLGLESPPKREVLSGFRNSVTGPDPFETLFIDQGRRARGRALPIYRPASGLTPAADQECPGIQRPGLTLLLDFEGQDGIAIPGEMYCRAGLARYRSQAE